MKEKKINEYIKHIEEKALKSPVKFKIEFNIDPEHPEQLLNEVIVHGNGGIIVMALARLMQENPDLVNISEHALKLYKDIQKNTKK